MEQHLAGTPLQLHAIDLVIAEIKQREHSADREEALILLNELRQRLLDDER